MISISLQQVDVLLSSLLYPFVRILAVISVAPVLGHHAIPVRVKVALAALLAALAAPVLPHTATVPIDSFAGYALLAHELLVGIAMGFGVRLVFAAVEMGGDLIGLQMGLSFAGFVDPGAGSETSVGAFMRTIATLLFLAINGHLLLIAGIVDSFERIPIAMTGGFLPMPQHLVAQAGQLFVIALSLSMPVIAILLIANLGLGVMSRLAPQLNIFAVSFPLTLVTGMATLLFTLPYLGTPLIRIMEQSVASLSLP